MQTCTYPYMFQLVSEKICAMCICHANNGPVVSAVPIRIRIHGTVQDMSDSHDQRDLGIKTSAVLTLIKIKRGLERNC